MKMTEPSKEVQKSKSTYYLRSALRLPKVLTSQMMSPSAAIDTARGVPTPAFSVTGAYTSVMETLVRKRSPEAVAQTPAVSLGRPKESFTPAITFSSDPGLEFSAPPAKITQSLRSRSLNVSRMISRKDSARSSTSSLGQGNITVIESVPQEGSFMDETHVYGTSGLQQESEPTADLNFSADHSEELASTVTGSSESAASSQPNPSDKVELSCLNQDESPTTSPQGRLADAGATPCKKATEAATTPPTGDAHNPTEQMPQSASAFSKVAESRRKSQVVANNAQMHILRQEEEIQRFINSFFQRIQSRI